MAKSKATTGKAKAKAAANPSSSSSANQYGILLGMDGNPRTPAEFDQTNHSDVEMYFNPSDEATDADKKRCKVLNYTHRCLKYDTQRSVPAVEDDTPEYIEVYHREEYMGDTFEVCVYFPSSEECAFKECVAVVKLLSTDLDDEYWAKEVISLSAAWTPEAQKDKFTLSVDKLTCNFWAPRWKYVVKYLRERVANDFDKFGIEVIPEKVSEVPRGTSASTASKKDGVVDIGEIIEEVIQVFSGAKGKIIGPKGSKIHEIKDNTGIQEITLPDKDGPKLRARELVDITLKGTLTQINAAKAMIDEVVNEWANAPRPHRDGGSYTAPIDYSTADNRGNDNFGATGGGEEDWAKPKAASGGTDNWADEVNAAGAASGDSWGKGAASSAAPW